MFDGISKYAENNSVSEEGFTNYYLDFNCVLPWEKDTYFTLAVTKTWGIGTDINAVSSKRLSELEDLIFEKIRQRTHAADDEGKTIKRFFKHFDLRLKGTLNLNEFKQSLEALGCQPNQVDLNALFNKLAGSNGEVNYEEFAGQMALRGTGNNPNVNPIFGLTREVPH